MNPSKYSHLRFLICLIIFAFLLSCTRKKEIQATGSARPNIIWLVCEDQSPEFFPMYGDSVVELPVLETLASQSIIFRNAYSPAPVCAPARSSIITGMYPTTLGTHNMRCYNAYNPDNQPEIDVPSYSPVVPDNVQPFTHYLRKEGYYCTNNAKEDYNFATLVSMWDESSKKATWRNREANQPFFAVFNFEVTHESMIWRNGDKELLVGPQSFKVPPYFPDDSVTRHDLAVNYSNLARLDKEIGEIIQQLKKDNLYDNSIIFFYSDHGGPFPRHKRALYETGTKVPLFVKFPGQQKTDWNDDLVSFIDFAPTVLSLAGIQPPDYMQGLALFGDYKSDSKRDYLYSASDRFDETYDRVRAVRSDKYKYIKNYFPEKPYALSISYRLNMPLMRHLIELSEEGALSDYQKLWMSDTKDPEELYDLEEDPYELNNLAGKIEYQSVLSDLRDKLINWENETNDLGGFNERDLINNWLIDGKQPVLQAPVPELIDGDSLELARNKGDATIIFKNPGDSSWAIYVRPIPLVQHMDLEFKTVRIGYQDSKIATFKN